MKILHLYRTYLPDTQGGVEEAIRQICYSSKLFGAESRVLTLSDNPNPKIVRRHEADVFRVKKQLEIASCSMSLALFSEYRKHVQWADLINIHFPWPYADFVHLLMRVEKPMVITYHSDIIKQRFLNILYKPLSRMFFKSATRIIATSPNYFATSNNLQDYSEKVTVIPLGLNEETYVLESDEINISEKWIREKFHRPFILFIGVLRYYKGLHILLKAAKELPCDVIIAGAGPLEKELRKQAKSDGIINVHFLGFVNSSDKIALLKNCYAVVFPSHLRSEAFGVTLLEGAMFAKPLISAELGTGTTHVNIDNETGIVVSPGNPSELHSAICKLLADPEKAKRMGQVSRRRYETLFSGRVLGSQYFELYKDLINKNAKKGSQKQYAA